MLYPTSDQSGPARTPRGRRLATAALLCAGALTLTGCFDEQDPDPGQSGTPSASASTPAGTPSGSTSPSGPSEESPSDAASPTTSGPASPTSSGSASETPAAGTIDLDQELPAEDLEFGRYDGPPRTVADVHHVSCLEALMDGQDVPETEPGEGEELSLLSQLGSISVSEGWKLCPPQGVAYLGVPASFSVEAEPGEYGLSTLRILDADGQRIGGLSDVGSGSDAGDTELVEVLEVEELESSPSHGDETAYLRSLVVEAPSGLQLLVDQVSAPAGEDPESLGVWDMAYAGADARAQVWAAVPLESAEEADQVADSRLHEVLRQMVGSYSPAIQ